MFETEGASANNRNQLLMLIALVVSVCIGFVIVGPLLGFLISFPLYDGTLTDFTDALQNPADNPGIKIPFFLLQASATLIGLIVTPLIVLVAFGQPISTVFPKAPLNLTPILLTPFIVVAFIGVNSVIVEWNAEMHFPEFLRGFEQWARQKEDLAAELTTFMTRFNSTGEFLIALLVIAIIPAIGEELVFRGLIQQKLSGLSGNPHVAIWLAAIIFSAFHLQFFGFLPRILLGALFGYLYFWSGNLTIAMFAHFVNNAFALFSLYFYQQGSMEFNPEEVKALPWSAVAVSALLTVGLLYYFKNYYKDRAAEVSAPES